MAIVGTKIGTKAFREPQPADIQRKETGSAGNQTAEDMKKLGVDNVGEYLNKISDPNFVDPSKKVRAVGSDKLDKDAFMRLMLAQMKQQDPTNPLKSHEMAAQLAQFSQLEQLSNMNTSLEAMREGQKPTESFQALNFIGKWVNGDSAKVIRTKGDKDHDFNFQLGKDAETITIKIRDDKGDIVRTADLKQLKQGENRWVWNGKKDNGSTAPAGEYQIIVEAKADKGQKVAVKTAFEGNISGVQYTAEGPVLMVGNQAIKLKDVRKIVDPAEREKEKLQQAQKPKAAEAQAPQNDQKKISSTPEPLKAATQADKMEKDEGAPDPTPAPGSQIMNEVGLSAGMKAKLEKETAL